MYRVIAHSRSRLLLGAAGLVAIVCLAGLLVARTGAAAATTSCPNGSTMTVVAHEDDAILFLNPDLQHAIAAGQCVRSVVVTFPYASTLIEDVV